MTEGNSVFLRAIPFFQEHKLVMKSEGMFCPHRNCDIALEGRSDRYRLLQDIALEGREFHPSNLISDQSIQSTHASN